MSPSTPAARRGCAGRGGGGGGRRGAGAAVAAVARVVVVVVAAGRGDEAKAATGTRSRRDVLVMTAHCSQVLSLIVKDLTTLAVCLPPRRHVASRPDRLRLVPCRRRLPFAEWVCLTLITPEGVPRLGAGHDARPRRRARPDLDAEPAAHLPGHRRARRQGADHPDRSGRRPRPRPGHPRRHPGRAAPRQAVAGHPGRAPARRAHRAARQAVPPRPGRASTTRPLLAAQQQLFAPTIDALDVDRRRRRPRRPVAPGERPGRAPLPRPGPPPARPAARRQARAAAQRPQPAPRHGHRRAPRRGDVHRQGRARRRSAADRGDHQGRRRRPRPRPRRRRRRRSSSRPR